MKKPTPKPDRSEIIELMKQRALCTGRSKAKEWVALTKQINALQRKMDGKK